MTPTNDFGIVNLATGEVLVTTNVVGWCERRAGTGQWVGGTACRFVFGEWLPVN